MALRFAVDDSVFGRSGRGGAAEEVDVEVADVVDVGMFAAVVEPVRPAKSLATDAPRAIEVNLPTEALVCPPLLSQGFGGDGVAIYTDVVAAQQSIRKRS